MVRQVLYEKEEQEDEMRNYNLGCLPICEEVTAQETDLPKAETEQHWKVMLYETRRDHRTLILNGC